MLYINYSEQKTSDLNKCVLGIITSEISYSELNQSLGPLSDHASEHFLYSDQKFYIQSIFILSIFLYLEHNFYLEYCSDYLLF